MTNLTDKSSSISTNLHEKKELFYYQSITTMFFITATIADSLMFVLSCIMLFKLRALPLNTLNLIAMWFFTLNILTIVLTFKYNKDYLINLLNPNPDYKNYLGILDVINFSTFCVAMYLINVKF